MGKKLDLPKYIRTNIVHLLKSSHLVKPHGHVIRSHWLLGNFVLWSICIRFICFSCRSTRWYKLWSLLQMVCSGEAIEEALFIFSVSDIKETWRTWEPLWKSQISRACDWLRFYCMNFDFRYLIQRPAATVRCKAVKWHENLFNHLVETFVCNTSEVDLFHFWWYMDSYFVWFLRWVHIVTKNFFNW